MAARNYSRKREAILSKIRGTDTHPTAEWLYRALKPQYPDLSLGTVYRNLALFRAEGEIVGVGTVHGQERFDGDTSPHAHFICTDCGAVIDVKADTADDRLYAAVRARTGASVTSHALTFYGSCKACLEAVTGS